MKKFIVLRKTAGIRGIYYRTISGKYTENRKHAHIYKAENKEQVYNSLKWDAEVFDIEEVEE